MEKERIKSEAVFKASLKMREDIDDEDSWESVEEDAPVIKLEELLGNLNIGDDDDENDEGEDQEEEKGDQE